MAIVHLDPLDYEDHHPTPRILDVQERCLFVFRDPRQEGYGIEQKLSEQDSIAPLAFPDCVIQVREFLRSPTQTSRA